MSRKNTKITPPNTVSDGEGVVRLALGGAVGKTTKTRAEGDAITAESDEKELKTLYAVIFKAEENTDEDDQLLFKAVNITDSIDLATKYTDGRADSIRFKVSTGDYQICFVGNPDEDLVGKIEALTAGASTAKNFKDLVAAQLPSRKPMLMTSAFYTATVETNKDTKLTDPVTLERAMARIDIVNKADGITIDSVKLVNRTVQSILINDNNVTLNTDYLGPDTTYKVNLAGSLSSPTKYQAKIYSYEQYGTDDNAPSMEVYYSIGEKNYKHTIDFKDSDEHQINLKRNYLYTVNITNNAGKLTFTLTVADWNQGTVFEVTSDELWDNLIDKYESAGVSDIMLSDGTIVTVKDGETLAADLQSKAIGIVVYRGTHFKDGVKSALSTPHGLVMALKNAANDVTYTSVTLGSTNQSTTIKELYETVIDGYAAYQLAKNYGSSYPIFDKVATYSESCPAPEGTTGWYIPSVGEWIDIFGSDGIGGLDVSDVISSSSDSGSLDGNGTVYSKINAALAKVGGESYYEALRTLSGGSYYWSSSEYSNDKAYWVGLLSSGTSEGIRHWSGKSNTYCDVRCILAF